LTRCGSLAYSAPPDHSWIKGEGMEGGERGKYEVEKGKEDPQCLKCVDAPCNQTDSLVTGSEVIDI